MKNQITEELDNLLLDERGLYKAPSYKALKKFCHRDLQDWAMSHAVYQFVTIELLEWLKEQIGETKALEINAGNGIIARSLGIIGIDNRSNQTKIFKNAVRQMYGCNYQDNCFTYPPKEIKKYEALEAVRFFKPEVVIGAFVTQKGSPLDDFRGHISYEGGVNETEMLTMIKKYIHFGNKTTHAGKFIYGKPHKELSFPWLINRSFDQDKNRVWIWENV